MKNKLDIDIDDYQHDEKATGATTSIRLGKKHFDFLKDKKINLSKLIREIIEKLMEKQKG